MLTYKKFIKNLKPYSPGKPIDEVRREIGLNDILKLASNENSLGPSPRAISAMKEAASKMHFYPEGGCYYLKKALSKKLGVSEKNIIIGNGSNEIIEFAVKGFLTEGDEVLSSEYAFAVYPILSQAYGGQYVTAPMKNYRFDLEGIANAITPKTKIIFIANPNNPTGTIVTKKEWENFLKNVPEDILICLDEAYFEFVTSSEYADGLEYLNRKNLIVLRTFSKIFGLAGLRIGYGVAEEEIVDYFNRIRQPFNVNAMAQAAALAALGDETHIQKTVAMVRSGKEFLYEAFKKRGIEFIPSETNFIMLKVNDAETAFKQLLAKGVIVRSMQSYGFQDYIRVTIGTAEENQKFLNEFDKTIKV